MSSLVFWLDELKTELSIMSSIVLLTLYLQIYTIISAA